MKVLAIAQYPPVGGIPTADGPINYALARYARLENAEILWVYARKPRGRSNLTDELDEMEIRTFEASRNLWTTFLSICQAMAVFPRVLHPRRVMLVAREGGIVRTGARVVARSFRPDVVYLASPYAALLDPKISGIPTVYNSMDSLTFSVDHGLLGRQTGCRAVVQRWLIHRLDRYLCAGRNLVLFVSKRDAQSSKYAERTDYVVNGADIERFRSSDLPEKAEVPTLVFQGSCHYPPNRRAIELIVNEIAPRVWQCEPTTVFRFVGTGCESMMGNDCRLQFIGYVDDLGQELRKAWVALAPIEDGSGVKNKVLDAAASGLPVVGYREAFNGIEGFPGSVLVSDPIQFAAVVNELIHDVRGSFALGQEARGYAESMSWQKQVARYVFLLMSASS